jgi:hypothetical protein
MGFAFVFKLEHADGSPADPPELHTAVPNWRPGDSIPLPPDRALRVVETRIDEGTDGDPLPTFTGQTRPTEERA